MNGLTIREFYISVFSFLSLLCIVNFGASIGWASMIQSGSDAMWYKCSCLVWFDPLTLQVEGD